MDPKSSAVFSIVQARLAYHRQHRRFPSRMRVGPAIARLYMPPGETEVTVHFPSKEPPAWILLVADQTLADFETVAEP